MKNVVFVTFALHEMTDASKNVFLQVCLCVQITTLDGMTDRLMCWSLKDNACKPKLKALKKVSPILASKLEHDIHEIQWMVSSEKNLTDV